jgi:hypothetical protein
MMPLGHMQPRQAHKAASTEKRAPSWLCSRASRLCGLGGLFKSRNSHRA